MLGRKTGACKEILFSPHRSYMFFNLLRCFGLQWSRKHLIFLLVAPPPKSPESSMRGAGHSPASWHWLYSCSLCTLHTHTHTFLFTPKMFYFPASLSKAAFHRCACLCCPSSSCSVHPAQELQPAVLPLLHQELGFHQSWALKPCTLRSLSPWEMSYSN